MSCKGPENEWKKLEFPEHIPGSIDCSNSKAHETDVEAKWRHPEHGNVCTECKEKIENAAGSGRI